MSGPAKGPTWTNSTIGTTSTVRFRVVLTVEALAQRAVLPPRPKRRVNQLLLDLETEPYGADSLQLELQSDEVVFRVREDGYRILYSPVPGKREVSVFRISLRAVAYEGYERPSRNR